MDNIVQSAARCTALGKYLNALAASFCTAGKEQGQPSGKRRCLHILYLVNDLLHHAKYNGNDASMAGKMQGILMDLMGSTASFKDCPKHQSKISKLLNLWQEKDYYSSSYIDKLREAANNAAMGEDIGRVANDGAEGSADSKIIKETPYVMPASHGDNSTPWFDLPAANLMPHIVPNSTKALNPDDIRPLQLVAGPADESLVNAVKILLEDVETIFGEADSVNKGEWDVDELGQMVELDEITGEIIAGEGYYGWSRKFCENMKRKKQGLDMPGPGERRGRGSRSRSSSRSIRKRRYSNSSEESDPDHNDRRRRRSYTSSRSVTPQRDRGSQSRNESRNRNDLRRQSVSPRRNGFHVEGKSSAVQPQNQPQVFPPFPPPPPLGLAGQIPFQQGFNAHIPPPPPVITSNMPYNNGFNNGGFNAAPFNGQPQPLWPPPPPPPHVSMSAPQKWPPPPPPSGPPPPQMYQQGANQQYPGNFTPFGSGNWQQQQPPPPQEQQQPPQYQQHGGGGHNQNNGWANNSSNRGRGSYRGRGRGW